MNRILVSGGAGFLGAHFRPVVQRMALGLCPSALKIAGPGNSDRLIKGDSAALHSEK